MDWFEVTARLSEEDARRLVEDLLDEYGYSIDWLDERHAYAARASLRGGVAVDIALYPAEGTTVLRFSARAGNPLSFVFFGLPALLWSQSGTRLRDLYESLVEALDEAELLVAIVEC